MEELIRLYFAYRASGWPPSLAWKHAATELEEGL